MIPVSAPHQLSYSSFLPNYFCLIEKHHTAFVCIPKNASTYLKSIAIYAKEGEILSVENDIRQRIGYIPPNKYLIPVAKMPQYKKRNGEVLKFAVWRVPVEHLISTYKWFLMEKNFNSLSLYKNDSFAKFLKFVELELGKSNPLSQDEQIRKQTDYYEPLDVDYIVHIKELNNFLIQNGIKTLDIPQNQSCQIHITVTEEQINKIKALYKEDYLLLNQENFIQDTTSAYSSYLRIAPYNNVYSNTLGMRGNMGKVISLFTMFQKTQEETWKLKAEDLLNEIWEKCSKDSPLSYANGLCGVGVGVEYLLQHSFAEGNADEVLSDLDYVIFHEINMRTLSELNVDNGILGIAYYLYQRLHYRKESEEETVLTLKEHTIYLIDWLEEAIMNHSTKADYYETYFTLTLLHKLNIFNIKIEKLMRHCENILTIK